LCAQVLNEVSAVFHEQLSAHPINVQRMKQNLPPANIVLLRGPGERIDVPTFEQMHGMKPFMIAPTCIIAGLGMSLGFDLVKAPGATGDYHTNLLSKAETALYMLGEGEYDFGFVHVKAVDDAGHDRDVEKKVHFIEKADEMIASIIKGVHTQLADSEDDCDVTIVVTGDHTTPVKYGDHTFEPVPFAIARVGNAFRALASSVAALPEESSPLIDEVASFSELSVARGALGRFSGDQVMEIIKKFRSYEP
jgi:2,3-diphosphopglycerate-independent phosphoglycerate mutase